VTADSRATSVPRTAHSDTDVGGFERRRIVDAIARHRHHLAVFLEHFDETQFLLGHHAGEYIHSCQPWCATSPSSKLSSSAPVTTSAWPARPIWRANRARSSRDNRR
jgi:hypothetical protein